MTNDVLEKREVKLTQWQDVGLDAISLVDNQLGRISYHNFLHHKLGYNFPEIWDPRVQQQIHRMGRDLNDWLDTRHTQGTFKKIMDIRPRGSCKSVTATGGAAPYIHMRDPEIAMAIMSASYEKMAAKFSAGIRNIWQGEDPDSLLVKIYGDFKPESIRERPWTANKMVTQRRKNLAHMDPTLAAYSIRQGPTSGHFKFFLIDDPITEELMENDREWLEKVWNAYSRMPFVLDRDGLLYLIMTRYHDADLVGRIIKEEIEPEVRKRVQLGAPEGKLPPDFNHDEGWIKYAHLAGWTVYYDSVYKDYDPSTGTGIPMYPTIWPESRISAVRRTERGEVNFWYQLMNKPHMREDRPITEEHIAKLWIESINQVPKRALMNTVICCDFAFKSEENAKKGRGDWGVAHVISIYDGKVYRLGGVREKCSQADFGVRLVNLVDWVYNSLGGRVRKITYELQTGHGSGDESTRMWLRNVFADHPDLPKPTPWPISRLRGRNRSKWQRIRQTAWAWQEGYVVLIEEAEYNDPLIYQMLNMGVARHDDDADAFADVFNENIYKKMLPETPNWDDPESRKNNPVPQPAVHGEWNWRTRRYEYTSPLKRGSSIKKGRLG